MLNFRKIIAESNNQLGKAKQLSSYLVNQAYPRKKNDPSEEKMLRVSQRTSNYKRSTNNSHKKFISVAKRLLTKMLSGPRRSAFETRFEEFKNSRTYFFIILAHAKLLLTHKQTQDFRKQFCIAMQTKIDLYKKQMDHTDNRNFIQFRCDQITDIEFAFSAVELYFQGNLEKAVEAIYKRDRPSLVKKQLYEQAVKIVKDLENQLAVSNPTPSLQNVIILQQNPSRAPLSIHLNTDPQPLSHFLLSNNPINRQSLISQPLRDQRILEGKNEQKKPLLFLENSYPYFSYFYQIMFPHQIQPNLFSSFPSHYQFNTIPSDQQLPSFLLPSQQAIEEDPVASILKGKPFVGKTAESDEQQYRKMEQESPNLIY